MITKLKSGFTLIELTVVIAIFGILTVIASNFLLNTLSTNNRTFIENEVRQNASLVMTDLAAEIRKAACVNFDQATSTLTLSQSIEDTATGCSGAASVIFQVNSSGILTKNSQNITSENVVFCQTANACDRSANCIVGLTITPGGVTTGAVEISLSARQRKPASRQDSCAAITLTETVTPRNARG